MPPKKQPCPIQKAKIFRRITNAFEKVQTESPPGFRKFSNLLDCCRGALSGVRIKKLERVSRAQDAFSGFVVRKKRLRRVLLKGRKPGQRQKLACDKVWVPALKYWTRLVNFDKIPESKQQTLLQNSCKYFEQEMGSSLRALFVDKAQKIQN